MTEQAFLAYFENRTGQLPKVSPNNEAMLRCPLHDDHTASLSLNPKKRSWYCHRCRVGGGVIQFEMQLKKCDRAAARRYLKDFFSPGLAKPSLREVAHYDYTDENGTVLKQVVRYATEGGKSFKQRRPDLKGGWVGSVKGVPEVPYRLPELLQAREVFIVEGEGDVETLRALGLVATTNAGGAGKWPDHFKKYFDGKGVVILPDNDEPGRCHADEVARNLHPVALTVKLLALLGLPPKGDVSDWLKAGHKPEELVELASNCALWQPSHLGQLNNSLPSAAQGDIASANHSLPGSYLPKRGENLTDMGNAKRLVALCGENLKYCHTSAKSGAWLIWNGKHWDEDQTAEISQLAKKAVLSIYQEASNEATLEKQLDLARWAKRSESLQRVKAMIELAQTEGPVSANILQFDKNPMLLNCLNGTIDLRSGTLRPQEKTDLITKVVPIVYEPHAPCSRWRSFLEEITGGRTELSSFLQQVVGYALTGDTSEQVLFFLLGPGANGKSTFLETVRLMLGGYAAASDFSMLVDGPAGRVRNDVARLVGKRFVTAVEVGNGQNLSEVITKQITGADTITTRLLFHEYFEYVPQFKLFIATNNMPRASSHDDAIWRRIRVIPFDADIPAERRDKRLKEKLMRELPGILAWAVEGCLIWQREGIHPPAEVTVASQECRDEQDSIGKFMRTSCIFGPNKFAFSSALYEAYENFCLTWGFRLESPKMLGGRLRKSGLANRRSGSNSNYGWDGVALR